MRRYSSQDIVRALTILGFERVSQRGSHLKLRAFREGRRRTVIVKMGARVMPPGTVASILRQAGVDKTELDAAL